MQHSETLIFGDTHPIEEVQEGVRRQIMGFDDKIMMVKVWFDEGAVGYEHQHHHSQVTYVMSGQFDVGIDGEVTRLKGGDSFRIPTNIRHGAVCVESGVLIDVFSPVREDFLIEAA